MTISPVEAGRKGRKEGPPRQVALFGFRRNQNPAGAVQRFDEAFELRPLKEMNMLYWALVFLVVAIIAGALGFGGIAGTSAGIAQILFFVFLAFLVISLLAGFFRRA